MKNIVLIILMGFSLLSLSQNDTTYKNILSIGIHPRFIYRSHENYYMYFLEGNRTLSGRHSLGLKVSFLPRVNRGHIYNSLYIIDKMYNGLLHVGLSSFTKNGFAFGVIPKYTYSIPIIGQRVKLGFSGSCGLHMLFNTCIDNSIKNVRFASFSIAPAFEFKTKRFCFSLLLFEHSLLFSSNKSKGYSRYSSISLGYFFNFKNN